MSPLEQASRNAPVSRSASSGAGLESRPTPVDVLLGAADELPAIHLGLSEDLADLAVVVVEDAAEQIGRPLDRGEALEHQEERHRHRLGGLEPTAGSSRRFDDRIGEPRADVGLLPLLDRLTCGRCTAGSRSTTR